MEVDIVLVVKARVVAIGVNTIAVVEDVRNVTVVVDRTEDVTVVVDRTEDVLVAG